MSSLENAWKRKNYLQQSMVRFVPLSFPVSKTLSSSILPVTCHLISGQSYGQLIGITVYRQLTTKVLIWLQLIDDVMSVLRQSRPQTPNFSCAPWRPWSPPSPPRRGLVHTVCVCASYPQLLRDSYTYHTLVTYTNHVCFTQINERVTAAPGDLLLAKPVPCPFLLRRQIMFKMELLQTVYEGRYVFLWLNQWPFLVNPFCQTVRLEKLYCHI